MTRLDEIRARFFAKVADASDPAACWIWKGGTAERGYGVFYLEGRNRRATQVSWELHHGKPFPPKMQACHTCDHPPCVNPAHLFVGDHSSNARDAMKKGRFKFAHDQPGWEPWQKKATHCAKGHEYTPENTKHEMGRGNQFRRCRTCLTANRHRAMKRWRAKQKEKTNGSA